MITQHEEPALNERGRGAGPSDIWWVCPKKEEPVGFYWTRPSPGTGHHTHIVVRYIPQNNENDRWIAVCDHPLRGLFLITAQSTARATMIAADVVVQTWT